MIVIIIVWQDISWDILWGIYSKLGICLNMGYEAPMMGVSQNGAYSRNAHVAGECDDHEIPWDLGILSPIRLLIMLIGWFSTFNFGNLMHHIYPKLNLWTWLKLSLETCLAQAQRDLLGMETQLQQLKLEAMLMCADFVFLPCADVLCSIIDNIIMIVPSHGVFGRAPGQSSCDFSRGAAGTGNGLCQNLGTL